MEHSAITIFTSFSLFFLIACNESTPKTTKAEGWTEEQKRKYFTDSISNLDGFGLYRAGDTVETFANFFRTHYPDIKTKNYYDAFTYALEEEYIDTTKIDTSRHWFRLIVRPCFNLPYCLTVEKKYGKSVLITKLTDGNGGNYTGNLIMTAKFSFDDTLYDNLSKELTRLNFCQLPLLGGAHGIDGETWTFESIEKGKYNFISRWMPQRWGDSSTRQLGQIGLRIRDLSRLDRILSSLRNVAHIEFRKCSPAERRTLF